MSTPILDAVIAHHVGTPPVVYVDHRTEAGQKKRERTLSRILGATVRVYASADAVHDAPVIEDVVREAKIARGTFYMYFSSLDEAKLAAGVEANAQMIVDIMPLYDFLKEPWQRLVVRFRAFLVRAAQDPTWCALVTRMDAWPLNAHMAVYMSADLMRGREWGQFRFDDIDAAIAFIIGASVGSIQAIRNGVPDATAYIDAGVRMMLRSLDCNAELQERALAFSRKHFAECESGQRKLWTRL